MSEINPHDRSYPEGFFAMFVSEFVSRFSFWGIQSLLVFYLVSRFAFSSSSAYAIFGVYAAMTWAVSIVGGYLADHFLGFRRILLHGFFLSLVGNLILLIHGQEMVFAGLAFLVVGMGLLIPNNASMTGVLYHPEDIRRDKGFSTFYVAGNIGGLAGPIVLGYVSHYFGWFAGFSVSALALLGWLMLYIKHRPVLLAKGNYEGKARTGLDFIPFLAFEHIIVVVFVLFASLVYFLFHDPKVTAYILALLGTIGLLYLLVLTKNISRRERMNVFILLVMVLFALFFFACEFQTLSSFILYMHDYIHMTYFGVTVPVTAFVSAEPLFVTLLTFLVINPLWRYLGKRQPRQFSKLGLGIGFAGISFLIFAYSAHRVSITGEKASLAWMVVGIIVMSLGELCVQPPLLAAITKLAPRKLQGTMMGFLFFAIAISGYLAGEIAKFTALISPDDKAASVLGFQYTYFYLAIFMLIIFVITMASVGVYKLRESH